MRTLLSGTISVLAAGLWQGGCRGKVIEQIVLPTVRVVGVIKTVYEKEHFGINKTIAFKAAIYVHKNAVRSQKFGGLLLHEMA